VEDFELMGFDDDEDSPGAFAGEEPGEVYDAAQPLGVDSKTPPLYFRGASVRLATCGKCCCLTTTTVDHLRWQA
jgi:hypothetical protein